MVAMGWLLLYGNGDDSLELSSRLRGVAEAQWPGPRGDFATYTKGAYDSIDALVYWAASGQGREAFQAGAPAPKPRAEPAQSSGPQTYRDPQKRFRFVVPAGWVTDTTDPSMIIKVNKGENNSFGVATVPPGSEVGPALVALATGLKQQGHQLTQEITLQVSGNTANGVEYNLKGGGEGALLVTKPGTQVYVLVAAFPDSKRDRSLQAGFGSMIESFRFKASSSASLQPEVFQDPNGIFSFQVPSGWTTDTSNPQTIVDVNRPGGTHFRVVIAQPGSTVQSVLVELATALKAEGNELTKEAELKLSGFPANGVLYNLKGGGEGALFVSQTGSHTFVVVADSLAPNDATRVGFETLFKTFKIK